MRIFAVTLVKQEFPNLSLGLTFLPPCLMCLASNQVARGGVDGVLSEVAHDGVLSLHKTIAELAAKSPKAADAAGQAETEHVLEQYHASRTIRRLILNSKSSLNGVDAPSFAATLWNTALKKKCKLWAKGHR